MKLKITDVVVHRLSVPLPRPVRTARHDHARADTVAVEMRTDAGLVGAGYCFAFGARRARARSPSWWRISRRPTSAGRRRRRRGTPRRGGR